MRINDIREKSDDELEKMLKELTSTQIKAKSVWGRELIERKEAGMHSKGKAVSGQKTSLQKDIRRNIARLKTIIRERKILKENEK